MRILGLILLCVLLCACDSGGVSVDELPKYAFETEEEAGYEYVWLDDEVPEDFDPSRDYLYLKFDLDDTWRYRVNPYSLRATSLCVDPLCTHEESACPYYGVKYISSDIVSRGDVIYFVGGQYATVMGFNGTSYVEMEAPKSGINAYNIVSGELTELVNHSEFCDSLLDFDLAVYEDWLYYYCEAPKVDERGNEIFEEDGDYVTETRLYRLALDGKSKPEDLGLYLGYTELIVENGYIWNYYGFFNESEFWRDVDQNAVVLTDLNNENPTVIPNMTEPVDDADGYQLAFDGSRMLLYTGDLAEPHVYISDEAILYYSDGWIWTTEILQEQWEEHGKIKTTQAGVAVTKKNIFTGETVVIENPPLPEDGLYLDAAAVVDGRYVIYCVYGMNPKWNSSAYAKLYYLRYDVETGEVYPIYP